MRAQVEVTSNCHSYPRPEPLIHLSRRYHLACKATIKLTVSSLGSTETRLMNKLDISPLRSHSTGLDSTNVTGPSNPDGSGFRFCISCGINSIPYRSQSRR
jgi:hypothetical protein